MPHYAHIDPAALLDLIEHDAEAFADLSRTFLRIGPPGMARLEAAIGIADCALVRHESHALKGSLMLLGAARCARHAQDLEQAAARAAPADFARLWPLLRAEFDAVVAEVAASIAEFGPRDGG